MHYDIKVKHYIGFQHQNVCNYFYLCSYTLCVSCILTIYCIPQVNIYSSLHFNLVILITIYTTNYPYRN